MCRLASGVAAVVISIALGATGAAGGVSTARLLVVAEGPHESGGVNYPANVYVVDVDGRHLHNLTHDHASNGWAQWTPDAKRIIFASHRSNTEEGPWHIYSINPDGGGRRRLTSAVGGAKPDLSPDGRRIAFVVERAHERALYVMNADGGRKRLLALRRDQRGAVAGELGPPDWSPDGRVILFWRAIWPASGPSRTSLYVVNQDGSGLTRLAHSESLLGASGWAPRGRTMLLMHGSYMTIAHVRRRADRLTLQRVRKIRLTGGYFAGWSPNGRSILVQNAGGLWVVPVDGGAKRRRFPVNSYGAPAWSPDQRWIAFASSHVLRTDPIEVARRTGRDRHVVTRGICCLLDEIAWAPR